MKHLRRILRCVTEAEPERTFHEKMAEISVRNLTVTGLHAYDVWLIAEEMVQLSLNSQENTSLFPLNQLPTEQHKRSK